MALSSKALIRALIAVLLAGLIPSTAAGSAAAAPYCGITWGSRYKSFVGSHGRDTGPLTNIRSGRHTCFDRLVFDIVGSDPFVAAQYPSTWTGLPVRGGQALHLHIEMDRYRPETSYSPSNPRELVNVTGYQTFRQVAWGARQPGVANVVVGVRARLPFRIFKLDDGATCRVVVDVAHRW
jgi:hypothetical protein